MAEAKKPKSPKKPVRRLKVNKVVKAKSKKKVPVKKKTATKKVSAKKSVANKTPVKKATSVDQKLEAASLVPVRVAPKVPVNDTSGTTAKENSESHVIPTRVIKTPKSVPLADGPAPKVPEREKPLTHKTIPISDEKVLNDVKPDVATPRRKLEPLELPIKGSKSVVEKDYDNYFSTGVPSTSPVNHDVFEDILEDIEASENIAVESPVELPTIGVAEKMYKQKGVEVTPEGIEPLAIKEDTVIDEGPRDEPEVQNKPAHAPEPHEEVQIEKERPPVTLHSSQDPVENVTSDVDEDPSVDAATDSKQDSDERPSMSHGAYHVSIKDRRYKSSTLYMIEFAVIIILVIIFMLVLVDAELIDLGFDLPFDIV